MIPSILLSDNSVDDNDDIVIDFDKPQQNIIRPIESKYLLMTKSKALSTNNHFSKSVHSIKKKKRNSKKPKKRKEKKIKQAPEEYNCPICDKVFHHKSSKRKHLKTHGDREFQCNKCLKQFIDSTKLRRHMLVHSGTKGFVCDICHKTFSLDFNLRTHMRIHTGEKPYVCLFPGCFKKFSQSSNLIVHEKCHESTNNNNKNNTTNTNDSTLFNKYTLSHLLNDLQTNKQVGTFNINNLHNLNRKYEMTQLQQYLRGNIKHTCVKLQTTLKGNNKKNSKNDLPENIFTIAKQKGRIKRFKTTIVYAENSFFDKEKSIENKEGESNEFINDETINKNDNQSISGMEMIK